MSSNRPQSSPTASEPVRGLLDRAFDGAFAETDWRNSLGGRHWLVFDEGTTERRMIAHAAVVCRRLTIDDRPIRTGYVEAVATDKAWQGQGIGTRVMRAAAERIEADYELGGLCTGEHRFYERLGWSRWQGPTFVARDGMWRRTPEEDDAVMILYTPSSPEIDRSRPIACDWRPGDVW